MAAQRSPQPIFDRTPPQNVDAERSVLGAMLLNPDAVGAAIEILREDAALVFYVEAHQHIYSAAVSLFRKNSPIDPVTLTEQLTRDGHLEAVGGISAVAELSDAVPTSANVEHYARIVLDAAILRKLISVCTVITGEAYGAPEDVNTLLDRAEANMFSIAETRQLNPIHKIADLIPAGVERIERIIKAHIGCTGLPTGFRKLDELLSGLQPSDMIVLAARPSIGKTALALNIAAHAAIQEGKSVLIFSLEMAKEQLVQRMLCMEGRINSQRLRSGFLAGEEFPKILPAADRLSRAKIAIDESPGISALDIRSKSRRYKAQHDLDLIIVDYMQLMRGSGRAENRQTEIADISRSIKGIARELSIPVMALSQLSREAEKDDTGVPKLAHLRESGAIEQDADVVLMLSRPSAGRRKELEAKYGSSVDAEKIIQLSIAKQRNGPTGAMYLLFDREVQHFGDLAKGIDEEPPSGESSFDDDDGGLPF